MVLLLMAETMLFAGLIAACVLLRTRTFAIWPPADLPRLPSGVTLAGTLLLLASAPALAAATQGRRKRWVLVAAVLGATFLTVQSIEWIHMLGWRPQDDAAYAGIFYALIGIHGLHVLGGLAALVWTALTPTAPTAPLRLKVCAMYWYFVVAVWPVIYGLVYH
jgi:heme/copper-type cytochrome/quinol oxidase subunit 3